MTKEQGARFSHFTRTIVLWCRMLILLKSLFLGIGETMKQIYLLYCICIFVVFDFGLAQKKLNNRSVDSLFEIYNAINSGRFCFKNSWSKVVNERIGGIMPALHHAINMKNQKAIKTLLKHGADVGVLIEDPGALCHQFNALHLAVAFGYFDIVLLLFKHSLSKSDINGLVGNDNKMGMASFTVLHLAAYFQHTALVELLLKKGVNVGVRTSESNKKFPGFKASEVTDDEKIRDILVKKEKKEIVFG